jgi:hypothetical protein
MTPFALVSFPESRMPDVRYEGPMKSSPILQNDGQGSSSPTRRGGLRSGHSQHLVEARIEGGQHDTSSSDGPLRTMISTIAMKALRTARTYGDCFASSFRRWTSQRKATPMTSWALRVPTNSVAGSEGMSVGCMHQQYVDMHEGMSTNHRGP